MNIYEKMLVEFFGKTDNINEAGYILQDGTLLDFSGRHFISDPMERKLFINANAIQHHDLFGCNYRGFSLEEIWPDFYDRNFRPSLSVMQLANAISVKSVIPDSDGFQINEALLRMMRVPTEKQWDVLLRHFEEHPINVSYVLEDGHIVADQRISFFTKSKLVSFLNESAKLSTDVKGYGFLPRMADVVRCSSIGSDYPSNNVLSKYKEWALRLSVYG